MLASSYPSVRLSIRMEQIGSHCSGLVNFDIGVFFRKYVYKIKVSLKYLTLHEVLCIFMIIPRRILLRMINISDKLSRENQNTFYVQ